MRINTLLACVSLVLVALAAAFSGAGVVTAQEDSAPACPSRIHLELVVQGLAFEPDTDRVDLDMTICNGTQEAQEVQFAVTGAPETWTAFVRPRIGSYAITFLSLEPESTEELRLRIAPSTPRAPGTYDLALRVSQGDTLLQEIDLMVEIPGGSMEEAEEEQVGVFLGTPFPVLRGPADSTFEFEMELRNRTGGDASFDLTAQSPPGWEVSFKPAFEDKLISSISVENARTERVKIEVDTPRQAETGAYPVVVTATGEEVGEQILLRVDITGSFDVFLSTPANRLNMDASAGDPSTGALRVINLGNAPLEDLGFSADPPSGWEVDFEFSRVESLQPQSISDVPFTITPANDAIPGDYEVTFRTSNPQVADSLVMRVTVTQSTVWGWVGIALVIVVIIALVGLFTRLGRR